MQFGEWTVLDDTVINGKVLCRCSCGVERYVNYNNLKLGLSDNCGHIRYKREQLEGEQFGEWTVLEYLGKSRYLCRCSCGVEKDIRRYDLINGISKSCGHKPLENTQINEWYVIKYVGKSKYLCRCSCGIEREVNGATLKSGASKSCGHDSKNKFIDYSGKVVSGMKILSFDNLKSKWLYECSCGEHDYESTYNIKKYGLHCKHTVNRFKDLTNLQFGEWTVLEYLGSSKWKCKCSCGKISDIDGYALTQGLSKSCGHANKKIINISNIKFGKLTAIEYKSPYWICKCECGNIVNVLSHNLRNGSTTSCGCSKILFKKEELLDIINNYKINNNNEKPFIYELSEILNVHEATIRKYITTYELDNEINKQYKSRYEKEILSIVGNAKTSDRTVIAPQELDIYIPEKKLAIEFNGDYWHSELYKDAMYHQQKTIDCAKQGIQLIHIFEHEWNDVRKKSILEKYLHSKVFGNTVTIMGRNTHIQEINNNDAKEFLNNNHLMGEYNSKINIALVHNNEIVSLISFSEPRFNNNEYQYEITRYCNKLGYSVIGGIEKLYSYFINKYKPTSIVTYTDISKFTGNCYLKIGFKTSEKMLTKPGYLWVKPGYNEVISRYKINKDFKYAYSDYGESEDEIMHNIGYVKVYNSGNLKLEWRKEV